MIGRRITVRPDRYDYLIGLLIDEGLAGDVDFIPTGGAEVVVTEAGWARLDDEVRGEIGRHATAGDLSPPAVAATTAEVSPSAVAVDVPADDGGKNGSAEVAAVSPRPSRRTRASTRSTTTRE